MDQAGLSTYQSNSGQSASQERRPVFIDLAGFPRKAIGRLHRRPKFARLVVSKLDLGEHLISLTARVPVEISEAPPDADRLRELLADIPPEHWSDLDARIAANHRCFLSLVQGRVVNVAWIATGAAYSY